MTTLSILLLIWIVGILVCFETLFHVFEHAKVGFKTNDIYFAIAVAGVSIIWPLYLPRVAILRIRNNRK